MKTNKTNQLHFIFLLVVLGSTFEFWWPIIALYLAKIKIKCTVSCSVRYYSAHKWKALPFFLQDLQFPSAWDFLWGTANPAAKEACCFHWFFVSQKLLFSDTHVRRILLLCLLLCSLLNWCKYVKYVFLSLPLFYPSLQTQPKFYIVAAVHPLWCFASQGKKYIQAWWLYWKKSTKCFSVALARWVCALWESWVQSCKCTGLHLCIHGQKLVAAPSLSP